MGHCLHLLLVEKQGKRYHSTLQAIKAVAGKKTNGMQVPACGRSAHSASGMGAQCGRFGIEDAEISQDSDGSRWEYISEELDAGLS